MSQKTLFRSGEGNAWFDRNRNNVSGGDSYYIIDLLNRSGLVPRKLLEIGCSNGIRLNEFREEFNCDCYGIDPSDKAIREGSRDFDNVILKVGTADDLPFENNSFDAVIAGFCLYLCDRDDLFKIAYEIDRVLEDAGTIIIVDFYPPFPYKNRYSHKEGLYSYKLDYSTMFLWNPAYREVAHLVHNRPGSTFHDHPDDWVATTILRKNKQFAYLEEPFS